MIGLVAAAYAQERSIARRCAEAAEGAEIEVCLRLAAEHPEQVDDLVSALVAWVDRAEAPDRELLDALLLLHSERAAEGAARLGSLVDPRAAALLADVALSHRDPSVREEAVRALGVREEAVPVLARVVADRGQPAEVRIAAAEALGSARSPDAADAMADLLRRPSLPRGVSQRLEAALAERWPGQGRVRSAADGSDGALWLAAGSSVGLAYALGAAGSLAGSEGREDTIAVQALAGATAGAPLGYLYGRAWPVEAGDAALLTAWTVGGTASGWLAGLGASGGDGDAALLGGLGGELLGLGVGVLATRGWSGGPGDVLEGSGLAWTAAGAAAAGAWAAGRTDEEAALAGGLTLGAALALGPALGREADLREDWSLVATGASLGGIGAALLPVEADPTLAPVAGALGGAALGGALGGLIRPDLETVAGAWSGGGFGAAAGYGAGLLGSADTGVAGAMGVGGLVLGAGAGTWLARANPDPIDDRDVAFAGTAAAFAGWNAAGLAELAGADPSRRDGAILLATSAGGGLAGAANRAVDVPIPDTLCAASLGVWGAYGGLLVGDLLDVEEPLPTALLASDVGLGLGALLASPWVGTPPLVIGMADAGGALGGAAAALGASLAGGDPDTLSLAALGGAIGGGAVGAALGSRWYRADGRSDMALRPLRLPPLALGPAPAGLGATVRVGPW